VKSISACNVCWKRCVGRADTARATEFCSSASAGRRGGVGRVAGSGALYDHWGNNADDELGSVRWKRGASLSVFQSDSYHQPPREARLSVAFF